MSARWWLRGGIRDFGGRVQESSRPLQRSGAQERPPALCPPRPSREPGARRPRVSPAASPRPTWRPAGGGASLHRGPGLGQGTEGPAAEAGPGVLGDARFCLRPGGGSATPLPGALRAHLPGVGVLCLGRGAAGGGCAAYPSGGCPAGRVLEDKARGDLRPRPGLGTPGELVPVMTFSLPGVPPPPRP